MSAETKELRKERTKYGEENNEAEMRESDNKYIKSCKGDKRKMVLDKLASDKLDDINILRPNKKKKSKGAMNLFREDGIIGESTEREEIMASFLQRVLWKKNGGEEKKSTPSFLNNVRMSGADCWLSDPFTWQELSVAINKLKSNEPDKPSKISSVEIH